MHKHLFKYHRSSISTGNHTILSGHWTLKTQKLLVHVKTCFFQFLHFGFELFQGFWAYSSQLWSGGNFWFDQSSGELWLNQFLGFLGQQKTCFKQRRCSGQCWSSGQWWSNSSQQFIKIFHIFIFYIFILTIFHFPKFLKQGWRWFGHGQLWRLGQLQVIILMDITTANFVFPASGGNLSLGFAFFDSAFLELAIWALWNKVL